MKIIYLIIFIIFLSSCNNSNDITKTNSWNTDKTNIEENSENNKDIIKFEDNKKEINWEIKIKNQEIIINWNATWKWYFEGSFVIELYNEDNLVSQNIAQANDDWMTSDYVWFDSNIKINNFKKENLKIIFKNANPSWLKENEITKEISFK